VHTTATKRQRQQGRRRYIHLQRLHEGGDVCGDYLIDPVLVDGGGVFGGWRRTNRLASGWFFVGNLFSIAGRAACAWCGEPENCEVRVNDQILGAA
jgi:hypothetical protein